MFGSGQYGGQRPIRPGAFPRPRRVAAVERISRRGGLSRDLRRCRPAPSLAGKNASRAGEMARAKGAGPAAPEPAVEVSAILVDGTPGIGPDTVRTSRPPRSRPPMPAAESRAQAGWTSTPSQGLDQPTRVNRMFISLGV